MANRSECERTGKFVKVLLMANLCLWVYVWISFAHESYPFRSNPYGHPAGTGYTFWGHSIGLLKSEFFHPFVNITHYVDFPSFALATFVVREFSPHQLLFSWFAAGVAGGGWSLLATMLLSFLQWYFIGLVGQKLWQRKFRHPDNLIESQG